MIRAFIRYIEFLKMIALECTNVSLLYSDPQNVSATYVAIFRVARIRIQPQLYV